VHQVGFYLHDYVEMRGQQNLNKTFSYKFRRVPKHVGGYFIHLLSTYLSACKFGSVS
jgi:hypothetical protein